MVVHRCAQMKQEDSSVHVVLVIAWLVMSVTVQISMSVLKVLMDVIRHVQIQLGVSHARVDLAIV